MMLRALKLLVSLGLALLVLGAGAWGGGAFGSAAIGGAGRALTRAAVAGPGRPSRATDELAPKDLGAGEIAVGDALVVNGQPMQLSLFYTSDAPVKVVSFYAEAFRARGLMPVASGEAAMAHVSAFDPADGLQRFISAVPQPDGQTLVMIGVTNPRKPPKLLNGAASASFPVPAENRAFLGFRSEDQGARAESAQFVSSLAPSAVADFYRKALPPLGWSLRPADSSESMVMFSKGQATLSVALQLLDEKKGAAVFVNRMEGDAR